ncbi:uncharacterized protein V1516DRAFT_620791 [Lipomyces oligophaga]|uniref:uncharacterized protein n=1 Tax=Lipomyces oligophaga TaxID=45792 RepID=UPI0034CDCBA2
MSLQGSEYPELQQHTYKPYIHQLDPAYFLPRAAAIDPTAPAIIHKCRSGRTVNRTYGEFADRARRLAAHFKRTYSASTKIGILASSTPMFLEVLYGTAGSGLTQASFNYRLSAPEIRDVVRIGGVGVIVVDIDFLPLLEQALAGKIKSYTIIVDLDWDDDTYPEELARFRHAGYMYATLGELFESLKMDRTPYDDLHFDNVPENNVLALAFTSGTTNLPKAVELTHRGMYLSAMGHIIESELNRSSGCRYLWTLPMFHAGGWSFPYAVTAVRGIHICLRKVNYDLIWDYLLAGPGKCVTHFNAAPTVNIQLCEHPRATRLAERVNVTVAASPPSPALFRRMMSLNLNPVHTYGLTETYGPMTRCYVLPSWESGPADVLYQKMAQQGHGFVTAQKIRVVKSSSNDELVDVASDGKEIGEIIFRGNTVMKGYHNNAAATLKAFRGGWLHTGDLAVMHADGNVEILDRDKDIIISGGENISSVAVENVIQAHPDVVEAAIVGIPDLTYGERPKAFIVLRQSGTEKTPEEFTKEIIAFARTRLGGFQIPRTIEIVDELPKTTTGKIRKKQLRETERAKFEMAQKTKTTAAHRQVFA